MMEIDVIRDALEAIERYYGAQRVSKISDALSALAALQTELDERERALETAREALREAEDSFDLIRRTVKNSQFAPNVFDALRDFAVWGRDAARAALAGVPVAGETAT